MNLRLLFGAATAFILNAGGSLECAAQESYPVRPVTVIVPLAPGGGVDIVTRFLMQKLSERMGQQFLVDYKPGAGTTIGTGYVAAAPADGYTLLSASANFSVVPALYRKLSWDPVKSFAHISLISKSTTLMLVNPALPVRNFQEYLAYAKAKPGVLNFGTTGIGSATHLGGAWLHATTGTRVTYVPFKGAGEVLVALAAGHVDVGFGSTTSSVPYVKAGKLRALGVANAERATLLPDIAPLAEQGAPGFDYVQWMGVFAPAALPVPILTRLNSEIVGLAKTPDVIKRFADIGERPIASTPDEFRQLVASEVQRWRKIVDETGTQLQD